ncbi:ABC transporter ATP-binding protein [Aminicella lysinilytica]|uniref:ABC transporter ATP-binding protein n=1 Tax=Aminicella lysinilytica TaxID=433323 RepID=UPI0026ECFAB2|nr:ABC transporter ATP-binding protein [Aminicella lysinilytica]
MKRDFKNMNMLQVFVSYFKPHKKLFLLDMTCALAISIIDLAFPYISRWCMYTLLPGKLWKTFWIVMAIVFVAYLFRSYFTYIIAYWGHTFGIRVEADIRRDLFGHIQKLGFDYFDNNRTGQLMSRLTADLFDITELAHHGPEDVFISAVTIVGSLIIMFSIQWRLAIVIALMLPVFMLVVWRCRRSMSEASLKLKQTTAEINADIESGLSGIKTAKAFANESREFKKFNKSNDTFKTSKRQFHKAMGRFNAVMEFFMCILSVAVIAVGGALIMKGQLNIIDLITFSLYVTTFVTPVRKLSNFAELFANGTAGLHRFIELMKTEPDLVDAEDAEDLTDVRGDIDVDHVSFAYQGDHDVLNDVTLHIREGETLALVGSSGGGKTTLSQLIPRFYDVTDGAVYIDGKDVRTVTQESLHRNIGVVQQDVFLFADSIAENIRYGRLDATEEEIVEAAKMAEIYDDIMDMPDGFDTNAGERGQLLSGGQKQRISIARIFLKNPPVLILDEATSALDSVTEAKIQETFDQLSVGRTTIVIAHRLSTVRNADRIAVIEHGEIIELGTHDELVEKNGVYAELEKTQELK